MRYEELFGQLQEALESGRVDRSDVEKLIQRRDRRRPAEIRPATGRPGIADVLAAAGAIVVFLGVALLYVLQWDDMHGAARTLSPFLFPAAALAASVGLHRAGRAGWESELAGMVGYVSLALAFVAAADAFEPSSYARFGLVAGTVATAVVVGMHLAVRNVRLTGWGLGAALVTLSGSAAALAGAGRPAAGLVLAGQALIAAALGWLLLDRSREGAGSAFRTALLLAYLAAIAGGAGQSYDQVSVWHLVISLAVVAAFVLAVSLDFDGMVWVGVVGALVWLAMAVAVIGSSSGWAFALVLMGLGLVGLSLLVAALRKRRIAIR